MHPFHVLRKHVPAVTPVAMSVTYTKHFSIISHRFTPSSYVSDRHICCPFNTRERGDDSRRVYLDNVTSSSPQFTARLEHCQQLRHQNNWPHCTRHLCGLCIRKSTFVSLEHSMSAQLPYKWIAPSIFVAISNNLATAEYLPSAPSRALHSLTHSYRQAHSC